MYYRLSQDYTICNDKNCSFLIRLNNSSDYRSSGESTILIPPYLGFILSRIGKYEAPAVISYLSWELQIKEEAVSTFINQLTDNNNQKIFNLSHSYHICFPSHLLSLSIEQDDRDFFECKNFNWKDEFIPKRPSFPISANVMVTTKCTTNCMYCYAKRDLHPLMTSGEIVSLIKELKNCGTTSVSLTGGDIFAMNGWQEIVTAAHECGYNPFLSTKTPLSHADIAMLKSIGTDRIQISLDSHRIENLIHLIGVEDNYIDKIRAMLVSCSRLKVNISIRSVLTKINGQLDDVIDFYNWLTQFDCICEWDMTPAFLSEYKKENYDDLELDNTTFKAIFDYFHKTDSKFPIRMNKLNENGYELNRCMTVKDFVCQNQICLGNTSTISILANGACSVCEMLYEHGDYILGNVRQSSILSIWNSEKAKKLYNPIQSNTNPASPCHGCEVFAECRLQFGKRVCYSDIQKMGKSWDYPDPRCPMAAKVNVIL